MTRTKKKSANQKCDFSEPSSLAFPTLLRKVPKDSHLLNTTQTEATRDLCQGSFKRMQHHPTLLEATCWEMLDSVGSTSVQTKPTPCDMLDRYQDPRISM